MTINREEKKKKKKRRKIGRLRRRLQREEVREARQEERQSQIRPIGRRTYVMLGRAFLVLLLAALLLNILVPDQKTSAKENRELAGVPSFSWERLISGEYTEDWNTYFSDQFAGRSFWRAVKVAVSRIGGSSKQNGVFIGKKGQLLEDIAVADEETLTANLQAIQAFAAEYPAVQMNMLLVPDAAAVIGSRLPTLASTEDQLQMFSMVKTTLGDSVEWIDVTSALVLHAGETIYYKTDDRWTTLGAFYAFQAAAPSLGISESISESYVAYAVTTNFNGNLAALTGVGLTRKEEIDIYVPSAGTEALTVDYLDEGRRTSSLYDSSALDTREQYNVFLGGDTSLIDIRTASEETARLLLIKDSFANCFIPFLTPYYREIVVVDPEYYDGNIAELMDDYRITDVLFLYSGNGFFENETLSTLLAVEAEDDETDETGDASEAEDDETGNTSEETAADETTTDGTTTDGTATDGTTTDGTATDGTTTDGTTTDGTTTDGTTTDVP